VHVPFCARRCDYCAFATWTDRDHLIASYAHACVADVERDRLPSATSVFFGGGTPSLMPPQLLTRILRAIDRAPGCEVTVEANPESLTSQSLDAWLAAGVSRVSIGVQSLARHVLRGLGRDHDPLIALQAVGMVKAAAVPTWNVDLIYGGAGETDDDWRSTVEAIAALDPPHVSAYALTVEPGTPLADDASRHPDDDVQAGRYHVVDEVLVAAGLANYEISNWARAGEECRHNLLYWSQGDYRGIGCAAHSHERGRRWWNVRTPERYIAAISDGRSPEVAADVLDVRTRELEARQLALRTRRGVPANAFSRDDLADLTDAGLVHGVLDRVVLTRDGRLLANEVAVRLQSTGGAGTSNT
jgi:putative oxygen-independent coproporphyrinogen III oxidase